MRTAVVLTILLCFALSTSGQENRFKVTRPAASDSSPSSAAGISKPAELPPGQLELLQPQGSGLVLAKLRSGPDLSAAFAGELRVTGTLIGIWPDGAINSTPTGPEYVLVLDKESSATTPHFVSLQQPRSIPYNVRSISITNGSSVLRNLAGRKRFERLIQARVDDVRITGQFVLDNVVVGVECDVAWAKARLVKSEVPSRTVVSQPFVSSHC